MKKRFLTSLVLALASIFASAQDQVTDTNKARMDALFQEMHDAATWGFPTTNGIQLGAEIKRFHVYTYLYDEGTNRWIGLFPPNGYRLSLSLKDAVGKDVQKTKEGEAITKPVGLFAKAQMKMRAGRIQNGFDLLSPKYPERYESPFNLLDCFNVEKTGTNTLMVGATLYKKSNDGDIYEIVLPPVSIRVPITQSDIDSYRASKNDAK